MNENDVTVKQNHKDTVFRKLFEDKKELLSLYNALFNTNYLDPDELVVTTLDNAIYLKHKNDLACVLDLRLSVIEQQSTINPNMPLRMLRYIVELYSELNAEYNIYSSRLIRLPYPSFIVLYNGIKEQPERREMRLSDAYMDSPVKEVNLELKVIQLNINEGYNEKLKNSCPTLMGYSYFVNSIRKNLSLGLDISKAVDTAVETCIKENILADFFRKNRKEVVSMSLFEYDEESYNRTLYEDGVLDGSENKQRVLISNMLDYGSSPELIHEMTKVPVDFIYSVQKSRTAASTVRDNEKPYNSDSV